MISVSIPGWVLLVALIVVWTIAFRWFWVGVISPQLDRLIAWRIRKLEGKD